MSIMVAIPLTSQISVRVGQLLQKPFSRIECDERLTASLFPMGSKPC